MARPIARGVLSFGLVAIPVEIHTATKDQTVRFHLLHAKCGSRVRNQTVCPACNVPLSAAISSAVSKVKRESTYNLLKKNLNPEAEANSNIDLREFMPISKVDPVYLESGYYLAPD